MSLVFFAGQGSESEPETAPDKEPPPAAADEEHAESEGAEKTVDSEKPDVAENDDDKDSDQTAALLKEGTQETHHYCWF